ncbi:MAG: efflux RND transporter permease subunit, partial [Verrucomicrobiota bacterium]
MKTGRLATLFLENRHLLVLTIVLMLAAGFSALQSLPRLEDPIITNRNPQVITIFPGATAERVEALVTEKIEQELKEIPEIKYVDTTSQAGVSVVAIELVDSVTSESNEQIFSEIRDRLSDAEAQFPEGVLSPDFDDKRNAVAYTLIVSVGWEDGREESLGLISRQAEELADRLRGVSGTELVRLFGAPEEEISVTLDDAEFTALGLTAADLSRALQRADAKTPAGTLRGSNSDLLIEMGGELDSVARISNVPIVQSESGRMVRIGDIAEVERGIREPTTEIALTDGNRTVLVAARVQADRRVDLWTTDALEAVDTFRENVGGGIETSIIFKQDAYTSARLGELAGNLGLGALVVFAVIFLSMGWRSSIIVGMALPLTAAITLFIVASIGGKLHQMSIFGMIIALGLLIDNAIVITDEVRKGLRGGLSRPEAVTAALRHLFLPLLSSTITTMLAFMPILLLPGGAGDFVGSIAVSVVIALGCSFFVAVTIIATFAGLFGQSSKEGWRWTAWLRNGVSAGWLTAATRGVLRFGLKRPILGVGAAIVVPVVGFALAATLGSQFFPRTDRNMFEIEVWLPTETSITETQNVANEIESIVRENSDVERVHWLIGGSFPSVYYNLIMDKDRSPFYAQAIVETDSFEATSAMVDDLQARLDQQLLGAQIVVSKFAQGPPAESDVELRLSGPSIETLQDLGEEVRVHLAEHSGILHTRVTMPRGEPKLKVDVSEEDALRAGLQLVDLSNQMQTILEGGVGGSVLEEIEDLPVRVRFSQDRRNAIGDIRDLRFVSAAAEGEWIPLAALGEVRLEPQIGAITRRDGVRTNKILGYAAGGTLPIDIANEVIASLNQSGFELPDGYSLKLGGETESQADAVGNLMLYLPILIIATIAILVLSFRSVRIALILLVVAPLSVGYGLLATWFGGFPLSFNTMIGSLGLMGLAFNSSIVVLAAIRANASAKTGD